MNKDQNIIGYIKDNTLCSRPQHSTEIVCPTVWVATKKGLFSIEAITNPSALVSEIAKKVNESSKKILLLFPLSNEEEFSKFTVAIDPRTITKVKSSLFLETNAIGMSVLNPITEEAKTKSLDQDTIPTHMTVNLREEGIVKVECRSLCLGSGNNHIRSHAYYNDPGAGGSNV